MLTIFRIYTICFCFFLFSNYITAQKNRNKNSTSFLIQQGEKYYARKEYKNALRVFLQVIDRKSKKGSPYFFVGMLYDMQKKYERSVDYFRQSINLPLEEKYRTIALWKLIYYYDKIKDYKKMLTYIAFLEKEINTTNLINLKRKALEKSGIEAFDAGYLQAKDLFDKYSVFYKKIKRDIDDGKLTYRYSKKDREKILRRFDDLRDAINISDVFADYAFLAGILLEKLREYDQARKFYSLVKSEKLKPKSNYKIGIIDKKLGKFEDSIKYFELALSDESLSDKIKTYAHINMAQSMIGLRKYSESYQHLERFVKWNSDYFLDYNGIIGMTYCTGYAESVILSKKKLIQVKLAWQKSVSIENSDDNTSFYSLNREENSLNRSYLFCNKLYEYFFYKKNQEFSNENFRFLIYYFLLNWDHLNHLLLGNQNIYTQFRNHILKFYFFDQDEKILQKDFSIKNTLSINTILDDTPWLFNNLHNIIVSLYNSKDYPLICSLGYTFSSYVVWNVRFLAVIGKSCGKISKNSIAIRFYREIIYREPYIEKEFLKILLSIKDQKMILKEIEDYFSESPKEAVKEILDFISTNSLFEKVYSSVKRSKWFRNMLKKQSLKEKVKKKKEKAKKKKQKNSKS